MTRLEEAVYAAAFIDAGNHTITAAHDRIWHAETELMKFRIQLKRDREGHNDDCPAGARLTPNQEEPTP